jgi:hypothetical protein
VVEVEIGIHLLQAPIFFFQLFQPLQIGHFHASILAFPSIIRAFGNLVFEADCSGGAVASISFNTLMIWLSQ